MTGMTGKLLLPLLASLGLILAIVVVVEQSHTPDSRPVSTAAPSPPYASFVAGAGIVETQRGNIEIGSPVPGILSQVMVKVGDRVKIGDPLFRIDDRDLQAQLSTAQAKLRVAMAEVGQPKHRLEYNETLHKRDAGAVSDQQLTELRDQLMVAEANRQLAEAQVARIRSEIDLHLVRAPVDGRVLRMTLRPGEYLSAGGSAPLLLFGEEKSLYLRVDVDETDAWRIRPGASATAFARGNSHIRIPLKFEYIEPYIIPKTSLTGRSTERTDTRVLQVLYSFDRAGEPVYAGQQMDVFIQAKPDTNGKGDG